MAAKQRFRPHRPGRRLAIARRGLLFGLGLLLIGLATGLWRLLGRPQGARKTQFDSGPRPESTPTDRSELVPHESHPMLLSVADAVVPRFGGHPAASEVDLLPRLERCIALSPDGPEFFRDHWHDFEREIRRLVRLQAGRPEPDALQAVLERWHREYEREDSPSLAASYFEGLRRNVLLAYYTSPAGWASVGYPGPAGEPRPPASARRG